MLKVEVWYHKDGDHLAVVEVPWWTDVYEELIANRFCPCCGISGWISGKSEKVEFIFYRIWDRMLQVTHAPRKELFKVPVESGCIARQALWPKKQDTCFRDDCEHCWHLGEDAFRHAP